MGSMHTMGHHSALKGRDILTPAPPWMDLEGILLSDIDSCEISHK